MKMKFFWIPARDSAAAEAELNVFLSGNSVEQVEKSFCTDADGSGWALGSGRGDEDLEGWRPPYVVRYGGKERGHA